MKPIVADTHTHTLASGHAYSTIMENVHWAAQKGLSFLCITEHAPEMHDAPQSSFFRNLYSIPDEIRRGEGAQKAPSAILWILTVLSISRKNCCAVWIG